MIQVSLKKGSFDMSKKLTAVEQLVDVHQGIIAKAATRKEDARGLFVLRKRLGHAAIVTISHESAARVIRSGLDARVVGRLAEANSVERSTLMKAIGIDKATLKRREQQRKKLDPPQAEATIRTVELITHAVETFGTGDKAWLWLKKPHPLLDGLSPLEYASNQYGAEKVRSMLSAIRFGGVV
jgi:putative toxin-antitoxin system antitoxin component (TIGR02293 family)